MKYPAYPIPKTKDAFVMIGMRKVKLPKPKWVVNSYGKNIECSYNIEQNVGRRYFIRLQAETHWTDVINIDLDLRCYRDKDLEKNPDLPIQINWGSGGRTGTYSTSQTAEIMASLWRVTHVIVRKLKNEVFYYAVSKKG